MPYDEWKAKYQREASAGPEARLRRQSQALGRGSHGRQKTSFAQGQLKSLVERIERLEEEKKTIAGDIKEVYAEAKANGFDTKILRKVISIRKKDRHEREEEEAMLDLYLERARHASRADRGGGVDQSRLGVAVEELAGRQSASACFCENRPGCPSSRLPLAERLTSSRSPLPSETVWNSGTIVAALACETMKAIRTWPLRWLAMRACSLTARPASNFLRRAVAANRLIGAETAASATRTGRRRQRKRSAA